MRSFGGATLAVEVALGQAAASGVALVGAAPNAVAIDLLSSIGAQRHRGRDLPVRIELEPEAEAAPALDAEVVDHPRSDHQTRRPEDVGAAHPHHPSVSVEVAQGDRGLGAEHEAGGDPLQGRALEIAALGPSQVGREDPPLAEVAQRAGHDLLAQVPRLVIGQIPAGQVVEAAVGEVPQPVDSLDPRHPAPAVLQAEAHLALRLHLRTEGVQAARRCRALELRNRRHHGVAELDADARPALVHTRGDQRDGGQRAYAAHGEPMPDHPAASEVPPGVGVSADQLARLEAPQVLGELGGRGVALDRVGAHRMPGNTQ